MINDLGLIYILHSFFGFLQIIPIPKTDLLYCFHFSFSKNFNLHIPIFGTGYAALIPVDFYPI